jgi:hypothetical protein
MKPTRTRQLLLLIFFLNIADTLLTWLSVSAGTAYEANPVTNRLLMWNTGGFFCIKIGLVSLALLFAHKRIKVDSPKYIYVFATIAVTMSFIVILGLIATLLTFV